MNRWLLFLMLAVSTCTVAGCAEKPDRRDCLFACNNLARLLANDRSDRSLRPHSGLDPASKRGMRNVESCVHDCQASADEDQVECLKKAVSVNSWLGCD